MTLDVRSIDLRASGVNRTDEDFAVAWCRSFGAGRSFYTALGHFDETWRDNRFRAMLRGALRWLVNIEPGSCDPRGGTNAVTPVLSRIDGISPGAVIELFGENLTPGAAMVADPRFWSGRLAGVSVRVNDAIAPLLYASPRQINFQVPWELSGAATRVAVTIGNRELASQQVPVLRVTPRILAVTRVENGVILWATGLGAVSPAVPAGSPSVLTVLSNTVERPEVTIDGDAARVSFSGIAPGWVGLYQVNVIAEGLSGEAHDYVLRIGGTETNWKQLQHHP
jgi:hypothetical protein